MVRFGGAGAQGNQSNNLLIIAYYYFMSTWFVFLSDCLRKYRIVGDVSWTWLKLVAQVTQGKILKLLRLIIYVIGIVCVFVCADSRFV